MTRRSIFLFSILGALFLSSCASTPGYPPVIGSGPITHGPVSPPPPFLMPRTVTHEVGPGETLWRISKIYHVDMDRLMRINRIRDPNQIQNGQKLLIPDTYGPEAVVPLFPNRRWTHIVVHHTATKVGNAREIDILHHKRGFFNGLGYHFVVNNGTDGKQDGQIEAGPRWMKQTHGAHANSNGMNEKGIGVAVIGNYSEDRLTSRSMESLVYLVQTLQNYYNIPNERVIGHRDVPGKNTECPGKNFPWTNFKRRLF